MEPREVDGRLGPDLVPHEAGEPPDLGLGVVQPRDEEDDDLRPDLHLREAPERVEDGLQVAAALLAVGPLREALQVDLVGRQDRAEVAERLLADRAVRDDDRPHPRSSARRPRRRGRTRRRRSARCRCRRRRGRPCRTARVATSSGVSVEAGTSSGRACEISQFWHQRQWKLQPAVPSERADAPGRTWKNGFFSIGSSASADGARVDERLQRSAPVLADSAVPARSLGDPAAAKAEAARDPRLREGRPPPGGMRRAAGPGRERREPGGRGRVLGPRHARTGEPLRRHRACSAEGRDEELAARLHFVTS